MSHGGRLVARSLKAAGVECVFTLTGGHVMGIYDGCIDEGIGVIDVRHEQAATHAADACYETSRLGEYIELAIRHALSGAPGPAFLEIPMDVLHAPIDLEAIELPRVRDYRVASTAPAALIDEAAAIVSGATNPMLMAGTALKWSEGGPALQRFVETTKIPAYTNGMARGELSMSHPQFFNRSRKHALAQADLVVLAGTALDFRMKYGASIPTDAKIVQLDLDETLIGQNHSADVGVGTDDATAGDDLRCRSPREHVTRNRERSSRRSNGPSPRANPHWSTSRCARTSMA